MTEIGNDALRPSSDGRVQSGARVMTQGVVYIHAEAGRAVRATNAPVAASDVLDCSGAVRAGDAVHVVVRGKDGGQGVVATGVMQCDVAMAMALRSGGPDAAHRVVIAEPRLVWPRRQ